METANNKKNKMSDAAKNFPGYPHYPTNEDIYNNSEKKDIDPDQLPLLIKTVANDKKIQWNEKDFTQDESGEDLDMTGAEFGDEKISNGNEDEENDYYSLGGDIHNNLDEDAD